MTAIVIGGGIAGLAAAASLTRSGWRVRVLESAPELGEVGAGLAVTVNGARALESIGALDAVRRTGAAVRPAGTRRADGKWLLRAPDGAGSQMVGIHRQRLHQALAEAASAAELTTGARVTGVVPGAAGGEPAHVTWESSDGTHEASADLVVGADGLRSVTRQQLFPSSRLTYSGYSSWRAVVDSPTDDRFAMVWGPRAEFGSLAIGAGQTYWYGYVALPAGHRFPDELQAAREYFASWAPDIRALTESTEQVIRHDVWTLEKPLPRYVEGRVVLIGDAAHPMLPTLGQGANSALEDGASLGALDLAQYQAQRYGRTEQLVRRSAQMAKVGAHLGRGQRLRNALLQLTPPNAAQRNGSKLFESWTPPVRVSREAG
ncbi:FAD-dependent monooxygenase [Kribbella italica]|uniref:2-polyprenyl-6-methoxyphenol hydroxylase-like FAD-dependent oxidoreductase n=1 Tax=Kribbella italica TaxID=1540520 RepID=A0A7W9MYP9_9ACTN|nr:FAD-dependent monooxygenase [Kribbella italica]MBB5840393.1 2-polyprenyl-6-methoxyphenol hydroxylase-like FAD-dependent oxidoreductase [Kribbella italica]